MSIEWSEAELQRHLHPSGGYTKHSKIYQLLIDELQQMGNEARAKFLNFVTACPHLPPVGLSMLEIEVLPPHSGGAFPTAQTCGNKLYLPEYETAEELRVKEPVLRRAWSALGKQSAQRQSVRGATVD